MAPIPPVSAARSVSARMRSLSWTAKLRRRGRADNSGDAAAGAGTTVGLRPPFAPSPAAASICLGSMGMTDDPSAPPSLNSRGKMSHLHWHGGMRRALAIDEASFSTDHPTAARALNNLAQLLQDTNRLGEAEPLMRRALAIGEVSFGNDHPNVAAGLNN